MKAYVAKIITSENGEAKTIESPPFLSRAQAEEWAYTQWISESRPFGGYTIRTVECDPSLIHHETN